MEKGKKEKKEKKTTTAKKIKSENDNKSVVVKEVINKAKEVVSSKDKNDKTSGKISKIVNLACLVIAIFVLQIVLVEILSLGYIYNNYLYTDISLVGSCLATIIILIIAKKKNVLFCEKESCKKTIFDGWTIILVAISLFILGLVFGHRLGFDFPNTIDAFGLIIQFLLVGLSEELLFRGFIQNYLIDKFGKDYRSIKMCIIISSIIFGLFHFSNLLTNTNVLAVIIQVIVTIVFGLYLGTIYYKNNNIYAVGLLHGLYDIGAGFVTLYLLNCDTTFGTDYGFDSLVVAVILLLPAIIYLSKGYLNDKLPEKEVLSKEYLKKYDKKFTTLTFSSMIILALFISFTLISYFNLDKNNAKEYSCVDIKYKELSNYIVHRESFDTYDFYSTDTELVMDDDSFEVVSIPYKYNLTINEDNNLFITDTNTGNAKEIVLNGDAVYKFAVIKNGDMFTILAYSLNDNITSTAKIFMSNYMTLENMKNSNFIDSFIKSFKKIPLNTIDGIGYLTINTDDYNYPLFIDDELLVYYYIDQDGNYYKY